MLSAKAKTIVLKPIAAALWLIFVAILIAQPVPAQNRVIGTYTFPDTPIKEFQNKAFPRQCRQ
jgi:hypothetical protein